MVKYIRVRLKPSQYSSKESLKSTE